MTLRQFVKDNREALTRTVNKALGEPESKPQPLSELENWVRNDEGLYIWARAEGWRG